MEERATVTRQLALAKVQRCSRDCAGLDVRRVTLAAKLDALNAEADEIRRQQAERNRVMVQRDALRTDPVTSRLATLFGAGTARVDMLSGLVFAAVLEGVACLLWAVALRPPSQSAPVPAVPEGMPTAAPPAANVTVMPQPPVTAIHVEEIVSREAAMNRHAAVTGGHTPRDDPVTPLPDVSSPDDDVTRLVGDIAAGRVRPTVADIRRYLGCSQHEPPPCAVSSPNAPRLLKPGSCPPINPSAGVCRRLPCRSRLPSGCRRRDVLVHFQKIPIMNQATTRLKPLFHPGRLLVTPAALAALRTNGVPVISIMLRHIAGDWGVISDDDKKQNDLSIATRLRLISLYHLPDGNPDHRDHGMGPISHNHREARWSRDQR
jgi:hypothetical protein